ncbi:MAG: hypothetical protein QM723_20620 [Myxococcaceae bacterium]
MIRRASLALLLAASCTAVTEAAQNVVLCIVPCADRNVPTQLPTAKARPVVAVSSAPLLGKRARSYRMAKPEGCVPGALPATPETWDDLLGEVLVRRCGVPGGCHFAGTKSPNGLDFAAPDAVDRLKRAEPMKCAQALGLTHPVVAGDAGVSMMVRVAEGDNCPEGTPTHGMNLDCDEISRVVWWVQAMQQ